MSNRPALSLPTVRQIERTPGYLTGGLSEYDPSRHCKGKHGLCSVLPQWVVTHHVHRGYRRSFYCDECLPAKHRAEVERSQWWWYVVLAFMSTAMLALSIVLLGVL